MKKVLRETWEYFKDGIHAALIIFGFCAGILLILGTAMVFLKLFMLFSDYLGLSPGLR